MLFLFYILYITIRKNKDLYKKLDLNFRGILNHLIFYSTVCYYRLLSKFYRDA